MQNQIGLRNQSVIEWGRLILMFFSIIITYQIDNLEGLFRFSQNIGINHTTNALKFYY